MTKAFKTPSVFERLPAELITCVLDQLDVPMLLRCTQTCHHLRLAVLQNVAFIYKIELFAAHLTDGPESTLVKATRLRVLGAHQEAWRRADRSSETRLSLSEAEVSMDSAWEFLGGVLGLSAGSRLRFIQVPSKLRSIEEKRWTIEDIGFKVKDFGMDPAQDLLVVLEIVHVGAESFRLHICDLATGKPHRLAVMPLFSYEALQRDGEWWYVIQIHGSLVAVLSQSLTAKPSELAIWNWKRGTLVKIVCGMLQSHSFLTEEYLMLATSSRLGDAAQLKIEIVQINSNRNKVIYLGQDAVFCSFDLPTLQKSIDDTEILIRTDHTSQASFPERKIQPFTTSREDRIIVIACTSMTHDLESNVLFVPLSYFLALIKQVSEFVTEQCSPAFPWQEWGPQGTRMIYRSLSDIWFCYVHGMRVIVPVPDGERVQIYDFNQRSIRRDLIRYGYCPHTSTPWPRPDLKKLHNAGQPGLDTAGEARPSEFGYGDVSITEDDDEEKLGTTIICRASACRTDIFEQEPKTSLACRRHTFRSPIEPVASGYMLGEDSIIAVPPNDGEFILLSF